MQRPGRPRSQEEDGSVADASGSDGPRIPLDRGPRSGHHEPDARPVAGRSTPSGGAPMPAPSALKGLPKPLLFGLYGAAAGLIGAVLLGEPAWQLLKPPPPPSPPPPAPQVAVSASAAVQVYPGTSNTFTVQVARADYAGPVTVGFTGLPAGAKIEPVTIPPEKASAEVTVTAGPGAAVGTSKVTVTAEGQGGATATTSLDLVIAPTPKPPPRLAVAVPPRMLVYRGGTCKFTVQIARAEFDGLVAVEIGPLPSGVTVTPAVITAGKTEAEVTLKAEPDATVTNSKLTV